MSQFWVDFFTDISMMDCIATALSAIAFFASIVSKRKNLNIKFIETECLYFPKAKEYKTTITNYQAFARVVICNRSSVPITITALDFGEQATISKYELPSIFFSGIHEGMLCATSYDIGQHQLLFPINLEPYQACDGYVFFRFFPDTSERYCKLPVRIKTSRHKKDIKATCKFTYYEYNPAFKLS